MMRRTAYYTGFLFLCLSVVFGAFHVIGAEEAPSRLDAIRRSSQEKVLSGVLAIYIWKMTDAVGLTEEQAARIFPIVRKAFQGRWQLAARRRNLLELLRRALEVTPRHESELKRLLDQWEENETKLQSAQEEMRQALTKVLSPEQQAKSLLFEQQFEGDLVRVIAEIRREQSQGLLQRGGPLGR